MIHAEYLTGNPLIGRKVWLIRHINGNRYGDPWDWSVVVLKPHFFSRKAMVMGAMHLNTYAGHKSLQIKLSEMGFTQALAYRKNGRLRSYNLEGAEHTGKPIYSQLADHK